MPFDIPNYDEVTIEAESLRAVPVAVAEDGWDPNQVELDLDELETCLSRR